MEENVLVVDNDKWQGLMTSSSITFDSGAWNKRIWQDLANMRSQQVLCDIQLVGKDGITLPAHSCILAAASSYLRKVLVQLTPQQTDVLLTLELQDMTSEVISCMLEFVYVGKFRIVASNLPQLLNAAKFLKITELEEVCLSLSEHHGSTSSAQQSFISALQEENQQHLQTCSQLIQEKERLMKIIEDQQQHINQMSSTEGNEEIKPDAEQNMAIGQSADGQMDINQETMALEEKYQQEGATEAVVYSSAEGALETVTNITEIKTEIIEAAIDTNLEDETVTHEEVVGDLVSESAGMTTVVERVEVECEAYVTLPHEDLDTSSRFRGPKGAYVCETCFKTFKKLSHLQAHYLTHTAARPWVCSMCNMAFKSKHNLHAHKLRHGDKSVPCSVCNLKFYTQADLQSHMKQHTGERPYVCNICQKGFTQKGNMLSHRAAKHFAGKQRQFECPHCAKRFTTRQILDRHLVRHRPVTQLQCDVCSATFSFAQKYKQHMNEVHNVAVTSTEPSDTGTTQCLICYKICSTPKELQRHTAIKHRKEKRYSCSEPGCVFTAYYPSEVRKHLRHHERWQATTKTDSVSTPQTPTTPTQLVCSACGLSFKRIGNLQQHERDYHGKAPEISELCDTCGEQFPNQLILRQHKIREHGHQDSLKCSECVQVFKSHSQLHKHTITVHQRQKRFKCTECIYKTYYYSEMKEHFKRKHKNETISVWQDFLIPGLIGEVEAPQTDDDNDSKLEHE